MSNERTKLGVMTLIFQYLVPYLSSAILNRHVPLLTICCLSLLVNCWQRWIPFRVNIMMRMQWKTSLMQLIKPDIMLEFVSEAIFYFNFNSSFVDNFTNSSCSNNSAVCRFENFFCMNLNVFCIYLAETLSSYLFWSNFETISNG